MRYVYIKNGDVIEQLLRIESLEAVENNGPDAFLSDLLGWIGDNPLLILSAAYRNRRYESKNVKAQVFLIKARKFGRPATALLRTAAFVRTLFLLFRFRPQRIICGRTGSMLWACSLYAALKSIPLIHSRHETLATPVVTGAKKWLDNIDKRCILKSKAVICHGPYLRDQLSRVGVAEEKLIPFDISFEDPSAQKKGNFKASAPSTPHTLLYIGRIWRGKGVFDLYNAFRQLDMIQTPAVLQYVGLGEDLAELKKRVLDDNLSDHVLFSGYVAHKHIFDIIKTSYAVVTPTRGIFGDQSEATEARCMTAMESLYMGVPVVAPDSGPFPYLIKHRSNGLLYKTNDYRSLAESLVELLSDIQLYRKIKTGAQQTPHHFGATMCISEAANKAFRL